MSPGPGRRHFVVSLGCSLVAPSAMLSACGTAPPAARRAASDAGTGATASDYRLANRVSWGATEAELERVRRLGASGYIAQQLKPVVDGGLPAAVQARIAALRIQQTPLATLVAEVEASRKRGDALPTEAERKAAQQAYQVELTNLAQQTANRHLLRALYSANQLQEQMTWFWFNHFNVHQYKSNLRAMLGDYEERAIRPHALGSFRDLLGGVAHHPAMLRYLDNEQNAAGRLNENLARELLELHTMGVDGGYSQRDVQEMARVLSGHGLNLSDKAPKFKPEQEALYRRDGLYEFNPARHDFGDKTVLDRKVTARGADELDEVLDRLAIHPSTARFVSGKIARHLLSDAPPAKLLDAMAAVWVREQGRIAPVLGVLLRSPEFRSPGLIRFKDPVHFVVSAVRACHEGREVLSTAPMQGWLNRLGEGLYNRQTPDGYPANAASWSSSGQLATRFEIARALGSGSAALFRADEVVVAAGMPAGVITVATAGASATALAGASAALPRGVPAVPIAAPAATAARPVEPPALPQLDRPIYRDTLRPLLAAPTREALDGAASPADWNSLYLSSPEFMHC